MGLAREVQTDPVCTGEFTYLAPSVKSSLYGNGKVYEKERRNWSESWGWGGSFCVLIKC